MSNGNGHHWSKFCWRDHMSDPALCGCSLAAKGFWIGILAMMHEGSPVGHLAVDGVPVTVERMASYVRCTVGQAKRALAELEAAGVFSISEKNTIFSRRMVRDAAQSDAGREHIAKRWNAGKRPSNEPNSLKTDNSDHTPPNSHPNSPPIRQAYRDPNSPPNSPPNRQAYRDPNSQSQKLEVESEKEVEKKASKLNNLPFSSPVLARGERLPDALDAVLSEAGVTKPEPKNVGAEVVQMEIRRTKKALEMRIPYGEVRSAEAQLEALKEHPKAAGAEATMGLKWQASEPTRTPEQQIEAATVGYTPEQLDAARRAFAARAGRVA